MKKEKGFTLVELLAIIVVIAAISTFALVNIDKKSEQYSEISAGQLDEIIKGAAHSYILSSDELTNKVKSSSEGYTISLNTLIDNGYISGKNLKNIKTRKDIDPNDVRIKITYGLNDKKTSYVYVYDVMGTREKYEYLYRANENNMELGASFKDLGTHQMYEVNDMELGASFKDLDTHQMYEVNGLLVYKSTDNSTDGTSATSLISKSRIDFSKYNKLIIEFDSIKITGNYWIGLWLTNGITTREESYEKPPEKPKNKYAGTNINKSDYILTIDVSDITDDLYVELVGTGRKDPTNTEFITIDKDTGSVEAKIKSIRLQYNEN